MTGFRSGLREFFYIRVLHFAPSADAGAYDDRKEDTNTVPR